MQEYARFIGIDVGKKRVGIAQTDLLQTIASPVGTYSQDEVFSILDEKLKESKILAFIVGWPLTPNGDEGAATEMVQKFIQKLLIKFPEIPIHKIDERYTSKMAKEAMIQGGLPKKKRQEKERVDRIAAALILQNYLDRIT